VICGRRLTGGRLVDGSPSAVTTIRGSLSSLRVAGARALSRPAPAGAVGWSAVARRFVASSSAAEATLPLDARGEYPTPPR